MFLLKWQPRIDDSYGDNTAAIHGAEREFINTLYSIILIFVV